MAAGPDEVANEVVGRVGEQLRRRRVLVHVRALAEHGDAVAEREGLGDVVGHEHDGRAQPALQLGELHLQLGAHQRVDRAEGLVHQQHRRLGGERAGHPDTLLLAAGQLSRVAGGESRVEADQGHHLERASSAPGALAQPSSRGTVVMLSSTVRCGKRPACWMT